MSARVLPVLRERRTFSPRQLSILLFFPGYTSEPVEEVDIAAALPFALEDGEGAA